MHDKPRNSLSQHPLEREASRFLELAKVKPDPSLLNVLQLLQWGLSSRALKLPSQDWQGLVQEQVDRLLASDPRAALQYLQKNPDDPESPFLRPSSLQHAMSPKEAAKVIYNALDLALTADPKFPDYPPNKYTTN